MGRCLVGHISSLKVSLEDISFNILEQLLNFVFFVDFDVQVDCFNH